MSDIWPHFVSGTDLENPWVDPFHIAHTHPLGGVDVSFEVHEDEIPVFLIFDMVFNN